MGWYADVNPLMPKRKATDSAAAKFVMIDDSPRESPPPIGKMANFDQKRANIVEDTLFHLAPPTAEAT